MPRHCWERSALALVAGLLGTVWPLGAWGVVGHQSIALIAEANLKPSARQKVQALLNEGESLASVATWADQIRPERRETGPWHYINIPVQRGRSRWQEYCPPEGCIIRELENFRRILRNRKAPREVRRDALRFVVHFVGDLHQPLHVADKGDRGGNDLKVLLPGEAGPRESNLHAVWDTEVVRRLGSDAAALATEWLGSLPAQQRRDWSRGKVEDWAWEVHAYSARVAYGLLPPGEKPLLNEEYFERCAPAARVLIIRAGLRLAALLNSHLK